MMKPTMELVFRMVKRTFPQHDPEDVLTILDQYESESPEGRARVQLAVLFASDGDLDRLRHYVEVARTDFRDLLGFTPEGLKEYQVWLSEGK